VHGSPETYECCTFAVLSPQPGCRLLHDCEGTAAGKRGSRRRGGGGIRRRRR